MTSPALRGLVIGGYELDTVAWEDGWSTTWLARRDDHSVWISIPDRGAPRNVIEDEIKILERLEGQGVPDIIEVLDYQGARAAVMKAKPGRMLVDVLRHDAAGLREGIWSFADRALENLTRLHDRGFVHLNLKPGTIWIGTDGGITFLDPLPLQPGDERSNSTAGTIPYMAPEQFDSIRHCDRRSDLFGLGLVLLEVFHGKPARSGASFDEHYEARHTPISPETGSRALDAFIESLVAIDPSDRFESAGQARTRLRGIVDTPRTVDHLTNSVWGEDKVEVPAAPSPHLITLQPAPLPSGSQPTMVAGDAPPPPDPSSGLLPDELIGGRYRVLREIGRGGQSIVYLVLDERSYLRELLAIRIPQQQLDDANELARRLRTQHKLEKILSDRIPDRVVRLRGVEPMEHRGGTRVGIVMEYMDGGTISDWVHHRWGGRPRTRTELTRLFTLLVPALEAIHALHRGAYLSHVPHLHRDIKPSNLLVDADGSICKLTDFYLTVPASSASSRSGTPAYMAPESFEGKSSVASEVFAIGATLYHLLSGTVPFEGADPVTRGEPADLTTKNPIVPTELAELVRRCMDRDVAARPATVEEVLGELMRLGLTGTVANSAPASLARLLVEHLPTEELDFLAVSLEAHGLHTAATDPTRRRIALIEEHCYTTPPRQVLSETCTTRQLVTIARALDLVLPPALRRDDIIDALLGALGFRPSRSDIPGIDSARRFLEDQLVELNHASSSDEVLGRIHSGLATVERVVDMLVRFYGQLLHGAGLGAALRARVHGKPPDRLTLGEKIGALNAFAATATPDVRVPRRVAEVFTWPILPRDLIEQLEALGKSRNRIAHGQTSTAELGRVGREVLRLAVDVTTRIAGSPHVPVVVQIVSRIEDIHGRHSYVGRDDRDRTERIFTPLPLELGALYLFYGVTNPVRINPLLFPYAPALKA